MTNANDLDIFFLATKKFTYSLCLSLNGTSRSFLYKYITILTMLKSEEYKINSLFKRHNKASHLRLSKSDRITITNLVNPERNYRTTRAHYITITRATNLGIARVTRFSNCNFLLNGFGDTHRIDWVCSLISGKTDYRLYTSLDSCGEDIVGANNIGLNSFHREELA